MITSREVLNTSFRDYVESKGRKLEDYVLVGIHSSTRISAPINVMGEENIEVLGDFMRKIPVTTEAVVDYEIQVIPYGENRNHQLVIQTGTALFLRKIDTPQTRS